MIALSWGRGERRGSWRLHHFVCKIRSLVEEFSADRLAKWDATRYVCRDLYAGITNVGWIVLSYGLYPGSFGAANRLVK